MNHKEMLSKLLEQHAELKSILGTVGLKTGDLPIGAEEVLVNLKTFQLKLEEHLKLENGEFYPELLRVLKEKGQDIRKTEEFIAEMMVLGKAVYAFLDKYSNSESITSNTENFKIDYDNMAEKILLRVAMEESGVYMYLQ